MVKFQFHIKHYEGEYYCEGFDELKDLLETLEKYDTNYFRCEIVCEADDEEESENT